MKRWRVIIASLALAAGAAAGWFAAGAWGKRKCENVEVCKYGNMEAANAGRAGASNEKAKSRRKAPIRSSADAEVQKRILENKISYLEKCIAAAKVSDAKPAEKKRETNAEIVARLMKLPTENERWTALERLDRKTNMSFTLGEMNPDSPKSPRQEYKLA